MQNSKSPQDRARKDPSPRWWVPALLAIPALLPLVASIITARGNGKVPTGFIQFDLPVYMANARQHFDQGFRLFYGNPYAGYDTPAIYFQPHIFLLGCLQQIGLDPGLTFNIFGLAALLFATFVAVRFYREVVGWNSAASKLGLVCFFWGGGVLTLAGLAYASILRKFDMGTVLRFDPWRGWWMLNFGRNLVYPTEAYYHGLFLLSILFLIRRRFGLAIGFAALMSISHPFTGLEAVLIVLAYLGLERAFGDMSIKLGHVVSSAALLVFHVGYYIFFLNRFADHRALVKQWELAWPYHPTTYVPALFFVGLLGVARLSRWPGWRQILREPRNRLFLIWFLVVFGLTQHYLIIKPFQAIHFAHGYDWTALFFLSAPLLVIVLDRLLRVEPSRLRALAVSAFMLFFLLDNIVWLAGFLNPHSEVADAISLTESQKQVLDWLGRTAAPRDMVVCADDTISYLVSTYTRVRSWKGHGVNQPSFAEHEREVNGAFQAGIIQPMWKTMHVFYISPHNNTGWTPPPNSRLVFRNGQFDIWDCRPISEAGQTEHGVISERHAVGGKGFPPRGWSRSATRSSFGGAR